MAKTECYRCSREYTEKCQQCFVETCDLHGQKIGGRWICDWCDYNNKINSKRR
jgi:hypothetical protein